MVGKYFLRDKNLKNYPVIGVDSVYSLLDRVNIAKFQVLRNMREHRLHAQSNSVDFQLNTASD